MRRMFVWLFAMVIATTAVPAAAAPPPGTPSARTVHLDFSGRGGTAIWSSYPEEPAVGAVYTNTFLSAVFVEKSNRTPVRSADALLEQWTFRINGEFEHSLLSSTSASGEIDLVVDRLDAASFEATLGSQTCVPVGYEYVCQEGSVVITGSWTGIGEPVRVKEHSTPGGEILGPPFLIVHERGVARQAVASAVVGGVPVPGRLLLGELFDTARSFVLVCRGGPAIDPAECPAP